MWNSAKLVRTTMQSSNASLTSTSISDTGRFSSTHAHLAVLGLLSPNRLITTREIHQHLELKGFDYTRRNIEAMLVGLCKEFPGIEKDTRSKPYGYSWNKLQQNPWHPPLSEREALLLQLAQEHLSLLLPSDVVQFMEPQFDQARRTLDPLSGPKPYRDWKRKVAVVPQLPRLISPLLIDGVLDEVSKALLNDCWLEIDYKNLAGKTLKSGRVMPLALVQQSERLFLVCQFEKFTDIRNLALHRLLCAKSTPFTFERPEFSLEDYIAAGGFGFGAGDRIQLHLEADPYLADLLRETPLAVDQSIDPIGQRFAIRATVVKCEQLRWWIRMHGEALRVLSPKDLMDRPKGPARTHHKT